MDTVGLSQGGVIQRYWISIKYVSEFSLFGSVLFQFAAENVVSVKKNEILIFCM